MAIQYSHIAYFRAEKINMINVITIEENFCKDLKECIKKLFNCKKLLMVLLQKNFKQKFCHDRR